MDGPGVEGLQKRLLVQTTLTRLKKTENEEIMTFRNLMLNILSSYDM